MRPKHSHLAGVTEDWPTPDKSADGFGEPLSRREDARLLAGRGSFVGDLAVISQ